MEGKQIRGRQEAAAGFEPPLDGIDNPVIGAGAEECVDFRQFTGGIVPVPFRETAGDDQAPAVPFCLVPGHLQDRVHCLLGGRFDESAGVHDDALGVRRVLGDRVTGGRKGPEHGFAVDQVPDAAEAVEINNHWHSISYSPVNSGFRFSMNAAIASMKSFDGMILELTDATYLSPSSILLPTP